MYSEIIISSILVAICQAGLLVQDNHQAVSSQSIVRHDQQPSHQINGHLSTPVLTHGPVLHHDGSFVHATPVVHATPYVQHAAPIVQHVTPVVHASPVHLAHAETEQHAPAHYEFSYSVDDPHTGDHKSQRESREGDIVKGEYSLLQPDGSIRKVEYTADPHSGFSAVVHNSAPNVHASPTPVHAAPVVHAAVPVYAHH